jgi:hypothetical protein
MLSRDILGIILKYFTVKELLDLSLICKTWYKVINNDNTTRQLFPLLPDQVKDGLIIPARGCSHDLIVLSRCTNKDVDASKIWKYYFTNYPTLSGSLLKNYRLIHNQIYPEIYMRAAAKSCIDVPIPKFRYPRYDLVEQITRRKLIAKNILGCENIEQVRKLILIKDFRIFHNTPRKAKIILHIIGKDLQKYMNKIIHITDSIIEWPSYEDPYYSQDVKEFLSDYSSLVNWQGKFYENDLGQGPSNPYRIKEFDEEFVMQHPHLWSLWNWKWVRRYIKFSKTNIKTIRKYVDMNKIRQKFAKIIL